MKKKIVEVMKHCKCPPKCFCKYDEHELLDVAYKKIVQKIPTVELIQNSQSKSGKELIEVVALLDLDDVVAEVMIREKMSDESCDVLGCRENLRSRIFKLLDIKDNKSVS